MLRTRMIGTDLSTPDPPLLSGVPQPDADPAAPRRDGRDQEQAVTIL